MSANGRAGASFEQALVNYAHEAGFPHAERLNNLNGWALWTPTEEVDDEGENQDYQSV